MSLPLQNTTFSGLWKVICATMNKGWTIAYLMQTDIVLIPTNSCRMSIILIILACVGAVYVFKDCDEPIKK